MRKLITDLDKCVGCVVREMKRIFERFEAYLAFLQDIGMKLPEALEIAEVSVTK